jgi:hypothetical protein
MAYRNGTVRGLRGGGCGLTRTETLTSSLGQTPGRVSTTEITAALVPFTSTGRDVTEKVITFVPWPDVISPLTMDHW